MVRVSATFHTLYKVLKMTTNIDILTPFSSAIALSGISIESNPPSNGDALVYDATVNQFKYRSIPSIANVVDLTSDQTITGVKTIATDLQFGAGAEITQGPNAFALPSISGILATIPTGAGNAFVDLTSTQTISGVKTISSDLQFSPSATITQSGNTFTLPSSSGTLTINPASGAFVDTTSTQTISGVKTISSDLQFGAGATITQGANTFTLPSSSGTLLVSSVSNPLIDTTSTQTISGVKTISSDLQFSPSATITQSGNTFTLPSSSGTLTINPASGAFVDTTSTQTISGVKTISSDLQFSPSATITQGANTFTLPSSSGTLTINPASGAFVDTESAQTIDGVKTISSDLQFSPSATITQSGNTFTLPSSSGTLTINPASGAFVDTTSTQTISGVKTISSDLQFGAGATITQGANTFTLPSSSGT